jgi:hypothetical protein
LYVRGIPPEVQRVIGYYRNENRLKAALVTGSGSERVSPWLSWRTAN